MRVRLLAFDSLGTRSMSTVVETSCGRILIDPGAALGPRRYGLKPHPLELERLRQHKELIEEEARDSDLIIVTHYHYDHFPRPWESVEWLRRKHILLKDPSHMINYSQRGRSRIFLEQLKRVEARPEIADGRTFKLGSCKIAFSNPVPHGNSSRLGYVLEVLIEDGGEKILHTSDVEGIVYDVQLEFVLKSRPNLLICDGPMTYMLGYRFEENELKTSIRNIVKVIESGVEEIVLDHHLIRDLEWRTRLREVFEAAEEVGVKMGCAADYMSVKEEPLEALRKQLYRDFPPTP